MFMVDEDMKCISSLRESLSRIMGKKFFRYFHVMKHFKERINYDNDCKDNKL